MPTFTEIAFPGAVDTYVYGANNRGDLVGFYLTPYTPSDPITVHGFLLHDGVFAPFNLPISSDSYTVPHDINNSGEIVGHYYDYTTNTGSSFFYEKGSFQEMVVPGSVETNALSLNDRGDIVGYFYYMFPRPDQLSEHGFVERNGSYEVIDVPGAVNTMAWGINTPGDIVGSYGAAVTLPDGAQTIRFHGFLDHHGQFTAIDVPGATATFAVGINDSGDIVGIYADKSGLHSFINEHGKFTTIDDGVTSGISDINDKEQIVGYFSDVSGYEGFLLS